MLLDYNAHIELFLTYRKCYVSRMMYLYVGKEIKGTLETRKEEENKNDWGREGERNRGREVEKREEGEGVLQKSRGSSSLTHVHWPVSLWGTHTIEKYR